MLLVPVLLVALLLGHGAQAAYFNTRPAITPAQNKVKTPNKTEVRGISTVSVNTPLPSPQITPSLTQTPKPTHTPTPSPKTVIPKSSASSGPIANNFSNQLLEALNNYRQKNGKSALSPDSKLQTYSKERSDLYQNIGKIDNHEGFNNLLKNNGFQKLGFMELAENSSFGYNLSARELIEDIFAKSDYHNKNMLNPIYTHIGIGVSGSAANLVFGGRKI